MGILDPVRLKQLVPLLQPTKTGEVSKAINENVITFFILCAIRRLASDFKQCEPPAVGAQVVIFRYLTQNLRDADEVSSRPKAVPCRLSSYVYYHNFTPVSCNCFFRAVWGFMGIFNGLNPPFSHNREDSFSWLRRESWQRRFFV